MSRIASLYSDQIKKHFKVFYANWEPGGPVELGDYGIMDGNIFVPVGNLQKDFAQQFPAGVIQVVPDTTKDQKEFKSEGGVQVNLAAKGSVSSSGATLVKASLEIKFSEKDAIFFNAADCTTTRISNKAMVGAIIKKLLDEQKWKKEYCVVTDIVQAGKTLIAISQSKDSSISFEAESPAFEKINLADASIKLNLTTERNIGYQVDGKDGLVLLLGLCKMKNPFLWFGAPIFTPKTFKMPESTIFRIENEPKITTERTTDELVFSQMGME